MNNQNFTTYLSIRQIKEFYPCLSIGNLANQRCRKEGCRYFKVGGKVLYRQEDLEAWLGSHPVLTRDSLPERG
jgi:hypothetical protein